MAIIYIDGFDAYNTAAIPNRWTVNQGSFAISAGTGQFNTNCLTSGSPQSRLWRDLAGGHARLIAGFAVKLPQQIIGPSQKLCQFLNGGVPGLQLRVTSGGGLALLQASGTDPGNTGGTINCSSGGPLLYANTWSYVEVQAKFADGLDYADCAIFVDGATVAVCRAEAAGAGAQGWTTADTFELGGDPSSPCQCSYDDLYIIDPDMGSANKRALGPCRVFTGWPSGGGSNTHFTPHGSGTNYGCVNENPPDGDTSYVSGATGDIDTYGFAALSPDPAFVWGVQLQIVARRDNAGIRTFQSEVRSGGANYTSPNVFVSPASYATFCDVWDQDPAGAIGWTGDSVTAAEYGYKVKA
jgi:hypothetical protein